MVAVFSLVGVSRSHTHLRKVRLTRNTRDVSDISSVVFHSQANRRISLEALAHA